MNFVLEREEKRNRLKERTHMLVFQNNHELSDAKKKAIITQIEEMGKAKEKYNEAKAKFDVERAEYMLRYNVYLNEKQERAKEEEEDDSTNKEARR